MDAVDILKICLRRWYVMLPILLGAAGVSYQLVDSQQTTYTAATSYGLVQPQLPDGASEADRDPLGADGKALVGAALQAQLNSQETQRKLGSSATRGWGPGESANGSSYSVEIPMYQTTYEVRAWGQDEQAVRDVVDRVVAAAPGITDELQTRAGAPAAVRYRPFVLAPTQVEALASTSAAKLVVAVMGVGLLVGAAWAIVADRLLGRRLQAERTMTRSPRPVLRPAGPRPTPSRQVPTGDPAVPSPRQRLSRAQLPPSGPSSLRR
ncbi:hypothetical protein GCM10009641_43780 [Mycobacterium cookii]|uniref:Capsular polysaccharide biosynthesis protein n=1 Tax=Nocardioides furvisabuli TaxID=375542 RepID=A0ABP5JFE2_9ACTN|nr:hypothetical protein [Nocardioides furvisabuli]